MFFLNQNKIKILIPYKKAPEEVKARVKETRRKWLSYRNFFERLFVFQFRKIYLRLDGAQQKDEAIYHLWTIIYDQDINHCNNTTIAVKMEDLKINSR